MNVLFMGSASTYQAGESREIMEQEIPFVRACEDMGFAAAARGYTLLVGDDHIACADYHVVNGAVQFATENPDVKVSIQLNRSDGSELVFPDLPTNIEVSRFFHQEVDRAVHGTGSLIPNLAALDASDVMVIIGGKLTAKLLGNIAVDKEKPVLAIPSFGGSSGELYERLKFLYRNALKDRYQDLSLLQTIWKDDSANKIMDLTEVLANKESVVPSHGYFISYNWDDSASADHVEVLLHRGGRRVNRDEGIFRAGTDLSDVVRSLIDDSDTFVALWSANFKGSSWCPQELEYARQRRHAGQKPTRVVLVTLDETQTPITFTDSIRLDGNSRGLRELSIGKLITQE